MKSLADAIPESLNIVTPNVVVVKDSIFAENADPAPTNAVACTV